MIDQGIPLQQFDMIAAYCVANKCSCLYMNFDNFKKLDATKKATVTTYYTSILDEDILDLLKNERMNVLQFTSEEYGSLAASGWFPKESQCPDADHYIQAYIVDDKGNITWENA